MNTKRHKIQMAALYNQDQTSTQQIKLRSEFYEGYLYKMFAIRYISLKTLIPCYSDVQLIKCLRGKDFTYLLHGAQSFLRR